MLNIIFASIQNFLAVDCFAGVQAPFTLFFPEPELVDQVFIFSVKI
jgi:hypothetical protein